MVQLRLHRAAREYGRLPRAIAGARHRPRARRLRSEGQPDKLFYERFGLSPDTAAMLGRMGYHLVEAKPWGGVELIESAQGRLYGASDSRRPDGAALGY